MTSVAARVRTAQAQARSRDSPRANEEGDDWIDDVSGPKRSGGTQPPLEGSDGMAAVTERSVTCRS
ncbi:hypothetical protein C486_05455 [Natrinema gari JCM 14663]|uniref:Uncharacterized protein n=1 Tax=Natrinema gari JCM 14663 TaxID=1230459 RepID=L9Z7R9_9EURY|nr:hypothetical protein C486_05455 [Natrinema gari JCM 14663]